MGRKSRTGVLKRLREVKKAEKAAYKRERRDLRKAGDEPGQSNVASQEDLEGYGLLAAEPSRDGDSR